MTTIDLDLDEVVRELAHRFGGVLTAEVIERCVVNVAARFDDARIETFLPLLVHRAARQQLEELEEVRCARR